MSDDGLRAALVAIKAKLQKRSDDGEAHLFLNIPYWELEELLAEYPADSPHLTDDGAALPVRRDGEDSLAAVPSSPHPTREHVAELLSNATRNLDYKQWETPHGMLPFADALLAAGLFGEGATPAIDREALWDAISDIRDAYPRLSNDAPTDEVIDAIWPLIGGTS